METNKQIPMIVDLKRNIDDWINNYNNYMEARNKLLYKIFSLDEELYNTVSHLLSNNMSPNYDDAKQLFLIVGGYIKKWGLDT